LYFEPKSSSEIAARSSAEKISFSKKQEHIASTFALTNSFFFAEGALPKDRFPTARKICSASNSSYKQKMKQESGQKQRKKKANRKRGRRVNEIIKDYGNSRKKEKRRKKESLENKKSIVIRVLELYTL